LKRIEKSRGKRALKRCVKKGNDRSEGNKGENKGPGGKEMKEKRSF
jgi:hypothetical protein